MGIRSVRPYKSVHVQVTTPGTDNLQGLEDLPAASNAPAPDRATRTGSVAWRGQDRTACAVNPSGVRQVAPEAPSGAACGPEARGPCQYVACRGMGIVLGLPFLGVCIRNLMPALIHIHAQQEKNRWKDHKDPCNVVRGRPPTLLQCISIHHQHHCCIMCRQSRGQL
jgi:hypothetical protein